MSDDADVYARDVEEIAASKIAEAVESLRAARRMLRSAAFRIVGDREVCRDLMSLADDVDHVAVRAVAMGRRRVGAAGD